MHRMFQPFSDGYYLGELYVEPRDSDRAVIQQADHEAMNEQLYTSDEGVERLDAPLVMKLDTAHFPVTGDEEIPSGTLAVPRSLLDEERASTREVFLADGDRAMEMLRYSGWEPATGT